MCQIVTITCVILTHKQHKQRLWQINPIHFAIFVMNNYGLPVESHRQYLQIHSTSSQMLLLSSFCLTTDSHHFHSWPKLHLSIRADSSYKESNLIIITLFVTLWICSLYFDITTIAISSAKPIMFTPFSISKQRTPSYVMVHCNWLNTEPCGSRYIVLFQPIIRVLFQYSFPEIIVQNS